MLYRLSDYLQIYKHLIIVKNVYDNESASKTLLNIKNSKAFGTEILDYEIDISDADESIKNKKVEN